MALYCLQPAGAEVLICAIQQLGQGRSRRSYTCLDQGLQALTMSDTPSDLQNGPTVGRELTFLSAWFCPFAQRCWIALLEKGVQFTLFEVGLKDPATGLWRQLEDKPAWFLKLNPLGKVPVLAYEEDSTVHSVYESSICNEFLEDYAPPPEAPQLLPPHPAARAHARMIVDRFNTKFVPVFYRILIRQDAESQHECGATLTAELLWLESMIDPQGPYFLGESFSLVDCTILPHFLRMYILKHYRGFELPARCKRLNTWYVHSTKRAAVKKTLVAPDGEQYETALLNHYSKYADASANSTSAKDFK